MTPLALIRHGPTAWNDDGRMQGHQDVPLTALARRTLATLKPPPALDGFAWVTSPLARARETARLIAPDIVATIEPALIEAAWGAWEGVALHALRLRHGDAFAAMERKGLDFLPPGGESPRMVQARLMPWLARLGAAGRPTVAVTHKGVIRAVLGLATGWDFLGKPPARLDWSAAHLFAVAADGAVTIDRMNVPLAPR
ncbi:MAG: histidine phosphatase family protein [Alphaproteobacteria bacterium]|nr:histidine phosphatase family protein [Alphaproteobacteria bacterium]